ncbi:lytic transglycosylase F [Oleiphilus sp. HI0125]|uniref:transglycosylase SLT domain-containing protein n=2 Tax=Oleiphilus sp. HI0125 TaxID=1822266 RepID=UPI000AEF2DD9|nr:lytic transglycosylase F [Oleiphilus sp. HI0125]
MYIHSFIFLILISLHLIAPLSYADSSVTSAGDVQTPVDAEEKATSEDTPETEDLYSVANAEFRDALSAVHHDDLFEIIERGSIRVLVTYSKTHFFLDKARQHGLSYEMLNTFEQYLNKRYKKRRKGRALSVIAIPVTRDELFEKLESGQAELAIANLTITPERKQFADFSIPTIKQVKEVIVANKSAPILKSIDDLSGKTVFVRESSSFNQHLLELNESFVAKGIPPVIVIHADEHLEVEDLIEMANANLIQYTVADDHIANLWLKIFDDVTSYPGLAINTGGSIAWAVRKNTPNLIYEVNRFLKRHRSGTLFGNIVKNRYLENPYWAKKALTEDSREKFETVVGIFEKYADLYDFNHLMLLAQGYQESTLDHSKKSPVGAIGIMQLMPKTGSSMKVGDIKELENNVHAGVKYLRKIINHYFNDPKISDANKVLFAFAAYNAGPTRIHRLRRTTKKLGLDPNKWFGNVEHAVARHVGRETVSYVANISKYFIAYQLIEEQQKIRDAVKESSNDTF